MERSAIKSFAIWARRHLHEQVTTRLTLYGITAAGLVEAQAVAGGLIVAGETLDAAEARQYEQLREHLTALMDGCAVGSKRYGEAIALLVDEIAYTWFNRLSALRYMEVNGYLQRRVLSSGDAGLVDPEILRSVGEIAELGDLPGLDRRTLQEWRSAGSRAGNVDEFLYRKLLGVQCGALAAGLPFLFDRSMDYTALFLPGNLLNQDSIVRRFVKDIPEGDWKDAPDSENGVEIIGWLYQFYISERKDEVIGAKSKVAARDIPAATQLFTPHWIVRYMVENSLGRLWLESHPESGLRSVMKFYLEDPHPPAPSPRAGEGEHEPEMEGGLELGGERERWEVSEGVRQKMKEVAREFRKQPTESEAVLWQALRGSKVAGRKFRRQQPIGTFVVDFFCAAERLIVEVDGAVHDVPEQQSLDAQRQMLLESLGLRFVRVSSQQVESNLATVLKTIEHAFQELTEARPPLAPAWERGPGGEGAILQPQDLTVMDPACGSGHILVYAFDLLFEIYKEQGYREREIPGLILAHNLHGLDIDARAVQLASFAVLMKARAKNSRLFREGGVVPSLNIVMVKSTRHLLTGNVGVKRGVGFEQRPEQLSFLPGVRQLGLGDVSSEVRGESAGIFSLGGLVRGDWQPLLEAFVEAENLGSLITPPEFDGEKLLAQVDAFALENSLFGAGEAADELRQVVQQAELLRRKYWVVVANPPYMGSKSFNSTLKVFIDKYFPDSKGDLFSASIERFFTLIQRGGMTSQVVMQSWMFLSSYESLRKKLLGEFSISTLLHMGNNVMGIAFGTVAFTLRFKHCDSLYGAYTWIENSDLDELQEQPKIFPAHNQRNSIAPQKRNIFFSSTENFEKIPGRPIAYWMSVNFLKSFESEISISNYFFSDGLTKTGKNEKYLRYFWEVNLIHAKDKNLYRMCAKGGDARKYYGNNEVLVNWSPSIRSHYKSDHVARITPEYLWEREGITWTKVSSTRATFRWLTNGMIAETGGPAIFPKDLSVSFYALGFLCSIVAEKMCSFINPTLNFQTDDILSLPFIVHKESETANEVRHIILLVQQDWDNFENSWDFQTHPLLLHGTPSLTQAFSTWETESETAFQKLKQLEEQNNRYWIEAYGLQDELTPEVPDDQITIRRADLERDIKSLISYAIGCIMGRYSLDTPGLIHAGQSFDPSRHTKFPADPDAILPITDQAYFDDDIVTRFIQFIETAYSKATLIENLDFIANALTLRTGETARDRIRRYFVTEFITDHIKTYKKRPIYWLFTSGKKRAFGALVYLHRYSPDTIGRLRTDYVLELQVKLDREIDRHQTELTTITSTPTKKALTKQLKTLQDQQLELRTYQAKLQTVADRRIHLDLDDGIAYNYTQFKGIVYEGTELKMADLEAKAQWKHDLLKQQNKGNVRLS